VPPPSSVLLDATPALDENGFRGVGRLVRELLDGLSETRGAWSAQLSIRALFGVDADGNAQITEDLAGAAEALRGRGGSVPREDLVLWRARSLRGASHTSDVLHVCRADDTPAFVHPHTVVTCHDLIPLLMPHAYLQGGRLRLVRRWLGEYVRHRFAARVVAISNRTRDDLVRILRLGAERIDVVPNGIDLSRWSPRPGPSDASRLRERALFGTDYVVFVGSGDPRKGIEAMLRAVARAQRARPLTLVWAGKLSDEERQRHVLEASRCCLEPAVQFVGYVSDEELAVLYRGATAHLFMSKLEGFGLSVAEAMACGCPVIVVRGSGADEVAGAAGFSVEPDDCLAAATAIEALRSDAGERSRRIAGGLARATSFSRQRMAEGYVHTWSKTQPRASSSDSSRPHSRRWL
jgi:glycosyltransferase involved in cell wall biosynthesis